MAERTLRISADLSLPLAIAGEAIGILATRGAGKSYTSAVIVEELHAAGVQLLVLDPTGVFWGLQSSANGKGDGLPITVLGGAHGNVPLEPTAGKLIADVIVDTGESLILDLSDFETKGAQTRFITDLIERLYHRKARARTTLHIVIDEANEFAPQKPMRDEPRMLGAVERLVGKGRSRGLAVTLITQRSAALNKNVLDLVDTLIALRVLGPRDRKAIADWIVVKQANDELGVVDSLPSLPTGTAWVWSPVRGILQKVAIRRIRTFDSYRTPEPGQERAEPAVRAPIDIDRLGEQIAATAERAKADDPKELRKEISALERQLSERPAEERVVEVEVTREVPVHVEVPVLNGQVEQLREVVGELRQIGEGMVMAGTGLAGVADSITTAIERVANAPKPVPRQAVAQPTPRPVAPSPSPRRAPAPTDGAIAAVSKAQRAFLTVLAQFPAGRTKSQAAVLAGYASTVSTTRNNLSALRTAGLITGMGSVGDPLRITEAGLQALGDDYEVLPGAGPALIDYWVGRLPMAQGKFLRALCAAYPGSLSKEEAARVAGYDPAVSTTRNNLSALRTLGLIEGIDPIRASEDLF